MVRAKENIKNNRGFTLIELMVVMAIIAVLAVLIVGAISVARKTSRDTVRRGHIKTLQIALESYYVKNKTYPTIARWGIEADALATALDTWMISSGYMTEDLKDPGGTAEAPRICYWGPTVTDPSTGKALTSVEYILRFVPEAKGTTTHACQDAGAERFDSK